MNTVKVMILIWSLFQLKPLYKKGSLTVPCNYRPKSLLLLISKNIEKFIPEQPSTFLISMKILYTYQYGLKKKFYGCIPFLFELQHFLKGSDEGMMTGMILIDLKKAFDTNDLDLLLQKLYAIGFSKRTVIWFKVYHSNRSFLFNLGE